jgi:hypothetical protein
MKAVRTLLLCSAIALPQLAMAELPSSQSLGMVKAILAYCAEVDPRDAASFQQEWASIVGGSTAQTLNVALGAGGYKQGFDFITGELKQLSKPGVAANCATGAAQWRGPARQIKPPKNRDENRDGRDSKTRR